MSYFDKYLKYKNKYLELKNMVSGGSEKLFGIAKIILLWIQHKNKPIPLPVTFPELVPYFSHYCWVGPPFKNDNYDYGYGFFIYKIKTNEKGIPEKDISQKIREIGNKLNIKYEVHENNNGAAYAVWKITSQNIGNIQILSSYKESEEIKKSIKFFTTIDLISTNGDTLPKETLYWWDHDLSCWIYQSKGIYYKAPLKR
jgi:hypothetical protein